MTPEQWREGMENEAASVEDAGWAGETRRAAARASWRKTFSSALLAVAFTMSATVLGFLWTVRAAIARNAEQNGLGVWQFISNTQMRVWPTRTLWHARDAGPDIVLAALLVALLTGLLSGRLRLPVWAPLLLTAIGIPLALRLAKSLAGMEADFSNYGHAGLALYSLPVLALAGWQIGRILPRRWISR